MGQPDLFVMLTWNDVTVPDAKEIFLAAKDAPARHWGFKSAGISPRDARRLAACMKENGKRTYLESLEIEESLCLKDAQLAADCGFDHLLGTVYFESVHELTRRAGIAYSPFVGLGADSRLRGSIAQIARQATDAEEKGVDGINLSAFRYLGGDPEELIKSLSSTLRSPFYIAGSVNSPARIRFLRSQNIKGFTIGGAFFEHKFGNTFSEQIAAVQKYLESEE